MQDVVCVAKILGALSSLVSAYILISLSPYTFHVPFYFSNNIASRFLSLYHEGSDPCSSAFLGLIQWSIKLWNYKVYTRRSPRSHFDSTYTAFCLHCIKTHISSYTQNELLD